MDILDEMQQIGVNWSEMCLLMGGYQDVWAAWDDQPIRPRFTYPCIRKAAGTQGVKLHSLLCHTFCQVTIVAFERLGAKNYDLFPREVVSRAQRA